MLQIAFLAVFLVILAVIAAAMYVVTIYNGLVAVKNNVDEAWANIDVVLKQRTDELGKLLDAVKAFMRYERDLLSNLTLLRTEVGRGGSGEQRIQAERELTAGIGRLLAVAENYPDLKSSRNFRELEARVTGLEQQIAHRREFYNDAVNINNIRMEEFPDRLIAPFAGLQRRVLFHASTEERADVDVAARLRDLTA